MSRYPRLRVERFIETLNLDHEYTYPELQELWHISREACRGRLRVANTAGYTIKLSAKRVKYNTSPRVYTYVFADDLGTPDQPECPRCKRNPAKRGRRGEIPRLYVDTDNADSDPFIYCRACGYWPAGDRVSQIQVILARAFAGHCKQWRDYVRV